MPLVTFGASSGRGFGFITKLKLPPFNGFTAPARMNGSTTSGPLFAITVNSSGRFVAVGYNPAGGADTSLFAYSDDGATWTTPAIMNNDLGADMRAVAVSGKGRFVSIGQSSGFTTKYSYSDNGSTWTAPAGMGGATTGQMYGVAVNAAGKFVTVGYDADGTNYPYYAYST